MSTKTTEERLYAKVAKDGETGHWGWEGALNNSGYGMFYMNGRTVPAHRVAWELTTEEAVLDTHKLADLCGRRDCVNPEHWELVTVAVWESRRAEVSASKRRAKTECLRGHKYTPENTRMSNGTRKCKTCEVGHSLRSRERATLRELGALEEAEELARVAEETTKRRAMLEADPYTLMSDRDLASAIRQSKVGAYETACDRHAQEIDWVLDSLEAQGVMVTTNKELEGVALEILDAIAESGTTPTEDLSARRLYWELRKSQDDATLQSEVEQRYSAELKDMKYRMFDEGSDQELDVVEFRREAALLTVKAIAEAELIEQNRSE